MTSGSTKALIGHAWAWRIRILFYIVIQYKGTIGFPLDSRNSICSNFTPTFYEGVCPSFYITKISKFRRLCECKVIEGYLQIENIPESEDMRDLTFPLLKEIKDFLLITNVEAHLNLTHLFPNLAIIRGEDILSQYAVIIFKTPNLVQSRLPSLRAIVRGYVYIVTQNCSESSEQWDAVIKNGSSQNNFNNNKIMSDRSENCRQCASGIVPKSGPYGLSCDENSSCSEECPKVCRKECALKSFCCLSMCLAGCQRSDVTGEMECIGCKYFRSNQKCVIQCNENEYKVGHSCVPKIWCDSQTTVIVPDKNECLLNTEMKFPEEDKPLDLADKLPPCGRIYKRIIYDSQQYGICLPFYKDERKFCGRVGGEIEIFFADNSLGLRECSVIEGSLTIRVSGEEFVRQELERNLANIREIRGYLAIYNVEQMKTISFLKNLVKIHGDSLYKQNYSLVIWDNQNLESLSGLMPNLEITFGMISIRNNPKLCLQDITEFFHSIIIRGGMFQHEIFNLSNGVYKTCHEELLQANLRPHVTFGTLEVSWKPPEKDLKFNISYYISYRVAENNITLNEDTARCNFGWKTVHYVMKENMKKSDYIRYNITGLLPDTRQAVRIRTLNGISETSKSNILYAKTNIYNPSNPKDIETLLNGSDLHVRWRPPLNPNGVVDHYEIILDKMSDVRFYHHLVLNFCDARVRKTFDNNQMKYKEKLSNEKRIWQLMSNKKFSSLNNNFTKTSSALKEEQTLRSFFNEGYDKEESFGKELPPFCVTKERHYGEFQHRVNVTGSQNLLLGKDYTEQLTSSNEAMVDEAFHNKWRREPIYTEKNFHWTKRLKKGTFSKKYQPREPKHTFRNLSSGYYRFCVVACQNTSCPTQKFQMEEKRCKLCSFVPECTSLFILNNYDDKNLKIEEDSIKIEEISDSVVNITWPFIETSQIIYYIITIKDKNNMNLLPKCVNNTQNKGKTMSVQIDNLPRGELTLVFKTIAFLYTGKSSKETYKIFHVKKGWSKLEALITTAAVIFIFFISFIFFTFGAKLYFRRKSHQLPFPKYINFDEKEMINADDLKVQEFLGKGQFGIVYRAIWKEEEVAVKEPRPSTNIYKFIKEVDVAKELNSHFLVKCYGAAMDSNKKYLYSVMELMHLGNLRDYLQKLDKQEEGFLMNAALGIADGMAYMDSMHLVHRDLAARNMLVDKNLTVKIADFGLTCSSIRNGNNSKNSSKTNSKDDIQNTDEVYEKEVLPIKWMPPESIEHKIFTSKSDVWSYGVILWEMAHEGKKVPFEDYCDEAINHMIVVERKTLPIPKNFSISLLTFIMEKSWEYHPDDRPTFIEIIELLLEDINKQYVQFTSDDISKFEKVSYYFTQYLRSSRSHGTNGSDSGLGGRLHKDIESEDSFEHHPILERIENDGLVCANFPPLRVALKSPKLAISCQMLRCSPMLQPSSAARQFKPNDENNESIELLHSGSS